MAKPTIVTDMKSARPLIFWIVTLALVAATVVLLHHVLLPFVAAATLAYLLDPVVNRLERIGMNRASATLFITGLFIVSVVFLLLLAIPIVGTEVATFIDNLPTYFKSLRSLVVEPNHPWVHKIVDLALSQAEQSSDELARVITALLQSLWSDGWALLSVFSLLVVTPIVTAYLIYDWKRILLAIDRSIPSEHRETVRSLAGEIDFKLAGFVRGQAMICLVLGAFYAIALRSIGLNHGLLIGLISGLIGFIPYAGSLTGALLAVSLAILQFGLTWTPVLMVLGIFFVGQSLADYVLAPVLVGNKVHLNPVWLIFALFAFGYLFGFVGLLVAVPLAAAIGVLVRFALRQYFASSSETFILADRCTDGDGSRLPRKTSP
jgi:predicted PurR-regulated permease PerM